MEFGASTNVLEAIAINTGLYGTMVKVFHRPVFSTFNGPYQEKDQLTRDAQTYIREAKKIHAKYKKR